MLPVAPELAFEDCGEQGVEFGGSWGLQARQPFDLRLQFVLFVRDAALLSEHGIET